MNAFSKAVVRDFSIEELEQAACLMRGYDLVALCAAGSGHSGGTLSMMEIVAALYLKVANHDPNMPEWEDRDRIVWSGGHKAPALYLGLGGVHWFAGAGPEHRCRHGVSGQDGRPETHSVLHHG
jgi:transketolase